MPTKNNAKAKASTSRNTSRAVKPASTELPAPFSQATREVYPFLPELSRKHVYIASVDKTTWQFKAQIFAVPLLTNIAIIAIILWRIYSIAPYYFNLCTSLIGVANETTMNPGAMTRRQLSSELGYLTFNFMADSMVYVILWPWPQAFFGPSKDGNPVRWRTSVGFRDQEITVRRSRNWDQLLGDVVSEGGEGSEGGRLFLTNVRQATSQVFMHEKTGYSMLNKSWDLDWRLMILLTKMFDKKEMSLDNFKSTVLVSSKQFGWVVFEAQDGSQSSKEVEGRRKILAFKDELTAMGKENLFFGWIELIQFESSQPGGFGPVRQEVAMQKAKDMFEAQGVDFDKFWEKIGGMEGMPGMD